METIVPCLYNSFSFTRANIFQAMCICDIQTHKNEAERARLRAPKAPLVPNPPREGSSSSSSSSSSSVTDTDTDAEPIPEIISPPPTQFDLSSMTAYFYTPNVQNDTLLWCSFIMINGIEEFECVENHYTESNIFKFKMVEYLREHKTLLKPYKITMSSIEETLVHKPFINIETFQAIAICYHLSVCIIQDRKIFEIGRSDHDANTFILEKSRGKFRLYVGRMTEKNAILEYVRERYWNMESISSPIRSISAYKLQDLVDICRKLEISDIKVVLGEFGSIVHQKKKTKQELYQEIVRAIT